MNELIVDNFAGGGGASAGIEAALGRPVDIAINHDGEALAMHAANHPETTHYCEDVWDVNPIAVTGGKPVGLAWFSPDCKHFSRAKGGKPVEKNIRGLAWVAIRWAATVRPRIAVIENIPEFSSWGPLVKGADGEQYPCPVRKGQTFRRWVRAWEELGYKIEYRTLTASDYGAPTIRQRLFVIARCDGLPIVWPTPTHGPGRSQPYRTAADCIDWSIPCRSVFGREHPLADATMRRIAQGIKRFLLDASEPFIVTCNHADESFRGQGLDTPFKTITAARDAHGLIVPHITKFRTNSVGHAIGTPLHTVTANGFVRRPGGAVPLGLVSPYLIKASAHAASLSGAFMAQHNTGVVGHPMTAPISTILAKGSNQALVSSHLIKLRGTCRDGQPVTAPLPTITAGGQHIGEVRALLVKYLANDRRRGGSAVTPEDLLGLVTIAGKLYQIADIGMRMLTPRELFRAQGFPERYIIDPAPNGKVLTKSAQVRMVGNSVCPPVAKAIVEANLTAEVYRRSA